MQAAPILGIVACVALALGVQPARGQGKDINLKRDIGLDQKLNGQVPPGASYRDDRGQYVTMGTYFTNKPIILVLPFFKCQGICTVELNGLTKALKGLTLTMGKDFEVVTASINPREDYNLASGKKAAYINELGKPELAGGWHFLVGPQSSIDAVTKAVGYRYQYDKEADSFIHPAGLIILTPSGKISKYFYGVNYNPRDLRLALVEASENRIGTLSEQILLSCYHFDPIKGRYGLAIDRVLKFGGILTAAMLALFVGTNLFRESRRTRGEQASATSANHSS